MMHFYRDNDSVGFYMTVGVPWGFAQVGDVLVYERQTVCVEPGEVKFRNTAKFITTADARVYLQAKYPTAVERVAPRPQERAA